MYVCMYVCISHDGSSIQDPGSTLAGHVETDRHSRIVGTYRDWPDSTTGRVGVVWQPFVHRVWRSPVSETRSQRSAATTNQQINSFGHSAELSRLQPQAVIVVRRNGSDTLDLVSVPNLSIPGRSNQAFLDLIRMFSPSFHSLQESVATGVLNFGNDRAKIHHPGR